MALRVDILVFVQRKMSIGRTEREGVGFLGGLCADMNMNGWTGPSGMRGNHETSQANIDRVLLSEFLQALARSCML